MKYILCFFLQCCADEYIFLAQYVKDCKRLYGRILGNNIVESSIQAKSKDQAVKVWTELLCPAEPLSWSAQVLLMVPFMRVMKL
jgi:hypothetical protein